MTGCADFCGGEADNVDVGVVLRDGPAFPVALVPRDVGRGINESMDTDAGIDTCDGDVGGTLEFVPWPCARARSAFSAVLDGGVDGEGIGSTLD